MGTLNVGTGAKAHVAELADSIVRVFAAAHEYRIDQSVVKRAVDALTKASATTLHLHGSVTVADEIAFGGDESTLTSGEPDDDEADV